VKVSFVFGPKKFVVVVVVAILVLFIIFFFIITDSRLIVNDFSFLCVCVAYRRR
jgi:hypothetical protein